MQKEVNGIADFTVIYVGAGEINFGSPEGPWSHSLRLEKRFGTSLKILGLIDPDTSRAKAQVALKHQAGIPGYGACQYWTTPEEASEALGSSLPVDLTIVGCPPHFRGGTTPSTNLDLRLLKVFPKCKRWLVEKPVSAADPAVELGLGTVLDAYKQSGAIVGVGYMMRALKAVEMMHKIIAEKHLTITGTQARYYMAYGHAAKEAWWNKHKSCGPIVEQATHLISLSLAFGGKPRLDSVFTHTVEHHEKPGKLSVLSFEENTIPEHSRVPRYTNSIWKYENGAVGSVIHVIGLHKNVYDTVFEVLADGYVFKLSEMYTDCPKLSITSPENHSTEHIAFQGDDPFQTQIDGLVANEPFCSYEDALATYELTWAIRKAGERH